MNIERAREVRTMLKTNAATIADDEQALKVKTLFDEWKTGESVKVGDRRLYQDKLYKVIQEHTTQADWTPDKTASLWTVIDESHAGTIEDPVPVPEQLTSFEYEWGKYYLEDEKIYLCNRQGGKVGDKYTLNHKPSQLAGQYFELAQP